MEFRPCIDIHNGKVKQIVGGSLSDFADYADENFVSDKDASFYANLYKKYGIRGGHVILLNSDDSEFYTATKEQALLALKTYPLGLMAGGGINPQNAEEFLDAGASHVIVTSYVFKDGKINYSRLKELVNCVGESRLVLDVSCKKKDNGYVIVTDRWQKETSEIITFDLLNELSTYCDEFLIHAIDVEGKADGVEEELLKILGRWNKKTITYAGGIHTFKDLELIKSLGNSKIHATIGSALDLFGGSMAFKDILDYMKQ